MSPRSAYVMLLIPMAVGSIGVGVPGLLDSLGFYGQGSSKFGCFLFGWTSGSATVAFFQVLGLLQRHRSAARQQGG